MDRKKRLRRWHIVGAFVIFGLAALWHFAYAWIQTDAAAAIFPVNESVWEHVKLFILPAIIYYVFEYIAVGRHYKNYVFAHGLTLVFTPGLTLALFYLYRDGLGIAESLIIDIAITFVCICIGLVIAYRMTLSNRRIGRPFIAWMIAAVMIAVCAVLTFFPLKTDMFQDSSTGGYGIEGFADHDDH